MVQFNQVLIWPHIYPRVKIGVWCIGPNDPSLAPKTYFLYSLHAQCIFNPAYEYQLYILKAKTAKTEEDYQKYLSIAIHFLEKMDEGRQPDVA